MTIERRLLTAVMTPLAGRGAIRRSSITLSTFDETRDGLRARIHLVTERAAPELYPHRARVGGPVTSAGIAPNS
ncbi:hypothetical protein LN456_04995 [Xanthomonas vesicatoria]|nr:hypothetical protein [Xanthomonas vesicatoria]